MKKKLYILIFLSLRIFCVQAQCPKFINGAGTASSNPYWVGCSGGNFTIFLQPDISIIGGYTVNWGDGTANSSGVNLIPPAFISHTYAAAIDTFPVTITTSSPACTISGVAVMELTPSASIQIPLGSPVYGCTPASFNFKNSSTNVSKTTRFTWSFGDGTPIQTFNYSNGGVVLSHAYLPGTTNCNVAVTLTAENYCNSGNPSTNVYQPIQVWDKDNPNITPDALIKCFPSTTFHFDNTTNLNCYALGNNQQRYEYWDFGDYWGLGHDSIINWQPFNPPGRAGYDLTYPGLGTYSVLLKDSSFCGMTQKTISVQITTPPTAALSLSKDTVCEGQSITAANLSTGGANQFIWNFGDGSGNIIVGNTASQTKTYNTAGTYTISLTANVAGASGCTSTASKQVVVKPKPGAGFNLGANNFCDTGTETFVNTSSGAIAAYLWNFGNGNTDVAASPAAQSYTGAGTYNVSLNVTGSNGCTASKTKQVKVFQSPDAQISAFSVCKGVSGTFANTSTSAAGDAIVSWLWNFGDLSAASSAQNPSHTFIDTGTYNVKLTAFTAFCSNKDSIAARVNPLPVSHYLQSATSGCTALTISFTNQSTGAATYTWNFGDGTAASTAVNPIHAFANTHTSDTTYHISLISVSSFGCADTFKTVITVFHAAHASFTSDYLLNCSPLPVQFSNTSTGATGYSWDFGDGTAADLTVSPNHIFLNNSSFVQTYITTLTISSSNGCTSAAVQNITLYPKPDFSFTALPVDSGCTALNVSFSASSGGALYQWTFGDGAASTAQSPNHTFINNGINDSLFHVELIATTPFSCKDTVNLGIRVYPLPKASFSKSSGLGCSPLIVSFTDNSVLAAAYLWDFGDGTSSIAASPIHTFINNTAATKIYSVILQVKTAFGCIDTMIRSVEVFPKVTAAFVTPANACSPVSIVMINNSVNAVSYSWDFGDGSLSAQTNPSHTYANLSGANKNDTIILSAQSSYGCTDTVASPITLFYKPSAGFSLSSNAGCPPFLATFTNLSTGAAYNNWTFGDGSSAGSIADTSHTYLNSSGSSVPENVRLIVTTANACADTAAKTLTVYPKATAGFNGQSSGCSPLGVALTNQSTNTNTYNWDLGDGTLSTQTNPTHTYLNNSGVAINYTILLTASSSFGCVDTQTAVVNVKFKPHAAFSLNTNTGCSPLSAVFTNQSLNAAHYQWNFGDGSVLDTLQSPLHTYSNITGITAAYTAKLIVSAGDACRDTTSQPINVYPQAAAAFTGFASGCSPLTISVSNQSVNTNSYTWDFGDGTLSTQTSLTHTYINNSAASVNYTILLTSSSSFGCVDTQTAVVNVKFKPNAAFSLSTNAACSPYTAYFTNQSVNAQRYHWNFGDGSPFDTIPSPSHVYTNGSGVSITNNITFIVTAADGCKDTAVNAAAVYPKVTAVFTFPALGCSPFTVNFINHSINASTYLWDFGNGNSSGQANPVNTYINSTAVNQVYTVRLIASSALGCADTVTGTTTAASQPNAGFSASPLSQLYPSASVSVINTTNAGTWNYSWVWGDSHTSVLQSPNPNVYSTWGTYVISLIVSSADCADTVSHSITIIPPLPLASFTIPSDSGCEPVKVCFTNTSQYDVSSTWDFGDGNSSNAQSPCYTYFSAGTFNVKLTVTGPGGQTNIANTSVFIYPTPKAIFSADPLVVQIPNTAANFLNLSIDADSYSWRFGDGGTSNAESPKYAYTQPGQYDVTLIASNYHGCRDSLTKPKYILAEQINDIVLPNAFTPNLSGPSGGAYDPSSYNNDVFFPFTINGIDQYSLTIFNRWGELLFESTDLKKGWDGYYKGVLCKNDVYIWKAEGKFIDGTPYKKAGDVTLIR